MAIKFNVIYDVYEMFSRNFH